MTLHPAGEAPRNLQVVARGGAWSLFGQLVPVALALALVPYMIRQLGVEGYGVYMFAVGVGALMLALDGGISGSAQRFFAVSGAAGDMAYVSRLLHSLLLLVLAAATALGVAVYLAAPAVVRLANIPIQLQDEAAAVLRLQAPIVAVALVQAVMRALLAANNRFRTLNLVAISAASAYSCGAFALLAAGGGVSALAVMLLAQQVLGVLILLPLVRHHVQPRLGLATRTELRQFFTYAWRTQVAGISAFTNLQADTLIIGAALPVRSVGIYSAGANFAMQLRAIPSNALSPMQSVLGRTIGARGLVETLQEFGRLQRLWVLSVTGYAAVALGSAWFTVSSWLGPELRQAGVIATILIVGNSINLLTGALTALLPALNLPGPLARYGVFSMVLNLVLTLPLVLFGVLGVVVATALAQIGGSLYLLRLTRRATQDPIPSFLVDVPWLPFFATTAVTAALQLLAQPLVPQGVAGLLACMLPAALGMSFYILTVPDLRSVVTRQVRRRRA